MQRFIFTRGLEFGGRFLALSLFLGVSDVEFGKDSKGTLRHAYQIRAFLDLPVKCRACCHWG